ncbi:MAG: hypothetical protein EOP00_01540 [Pedobacter sp.]|nr:MAG: hypothetical protein EOP00_01540 [Pedobacter sp.]
MKKLLSLIAIAVLGISTTFAQTPATKKVVTVKPATSTTVKKEVKKAGTTTKATTTVKLKADGTPDMRYSENKAKKVVVAGPKKKDGTADMRYKANKAAAKKN